MTKTQKALQMAREALRLAYAVDVIPKHAPIHETFAAIDEALAEQERPPVAWLCRRQTGGSLFVYTENQLHELGYGNISVPPFDKVAPLYTREDV